MIATPTAVSAAKQQIQLGLPSTYYQTADTTADDDASGDDNPVPASALADYQAFMDRLRTGGNVWPGGAAPQSLLQLGLPSTYRQDGGASGGVQLAGNTPRPWDNVLGQPVAGFTDGPSLPFGEPNDVTPQLDARLNQPTKPDPVLGSSAQGTKYLKDSGFFDSASPGFQTRIDPIPGYDQTGPFAWRASNDQAFLDAVNQFNAKHAFLPGDIRYATADMLKAQAMIETGGTPKAFLADPLQVNTPLNWSDAKIANGGLTGPDEPMTPALSASAGLEWRDYKRWNGKTNDYDGDYEALKAYNANSRKTRSSGDLPHNVWYGRQVINLANAAAAASKK
jgi:hypothetical protein